MELLILALVAGATVSVMAWVGQGFVKALEAQASMHRVTSLRMMAEDAAATVVAERGRRTFAQLREATIQALASAPGVPTRNRMALERVAVSALVRLGISNNG